MCVVFNFVPNSCPQDQKKKIETLDFSFCFCFFFTNDSPKKKVFASKNLFFFGVFVELILKKKIFHTLSIFFYNRTIISKTPSKRKKN